MMPQVHSASSWATSTVAERVTLALVALFGLAASGWLLAAGHHVAAGVAVLVLTVIAVATATVIEETS